MSKLTDIKYKIDQLDGGEFQNLCDAYLSWKGYKNCYSLGMMSGTNKTAKGNPDTYFLTADKKYVFVMYTTQKTGFVKKALEDLQKCFDIQKTGVSVDCIAEIVYCHTYGRISPGDNQTLQRFCEKKHVNLVLIGIDELGNDLLLRCPHLAKDFLGVSVDTGQILPLEAFIATHDANEISAPLNTGFLFRQKELEDAIQFMAQDDILLISGPAGVGKTRFVIELCRTLLDENKYQVLCIKSGGLPIYEDLIASLCGGGDKEYLVFVDDANELSGLSHILERLPKVANGSPHISKLVMTVRDYARKEVMKQVLEVGRPRIMEIAPLKDNDIRQLLDKQFGITNRLYTDKIVAIAEGNARLANGE